ncbi:Uncharacterised protein [Zhongshania aliphaticivorans]|uniref:Phasin domain-containing protein n=1 Tax=Zhongshania aliphaticivorans TaxID=1470434 RepID=A0A5S9PHJ9_9GAMM|nr:hypothetical protein [Zhongshania aliphaticivorans]CAA0103495.1 Uncharacterised protein [Zhongshania aliphaticivorans]CAA0113472.1 Uncharacterised protein [Zhongshania aliphaticivorans]
MTEASKIEKASAIAKDVFLANLGLAGKVFEQSQDLLKQTEAKLKETESKYKDAYSKRNELFDSLVARGEKVQSDTLTKFEESKTQLTSKIESSKSQVVVKFNDTKAQAIAKFEELKSESNAAVEGQMKTLRANFDKVKGKVSGSSDEVVEAVAEATAS